MRSQIQNYENLGMINSLETAPQPSNIWNKANHKSYNKDMMTQILY